MVEDCIVYNRWIPLERRRVAQLVIPRALAEEAVKRAHQGPAAGHLGIEKTLHRLRQLYYVAGAYSAVKRFVQACLSCQQVKGNAVNRAALQHQPDPTGPFDRISMDMMEMSRAKKAWTQILTVVDHYTRYCLVIPLRNKLKETVANAILEKIVAVYGPPTTIQSDHGSEFFNRLLPAICEDLGTKMHFTIV